MVMGFVAVVVAYVGAVGVLVAAIVTDVLRGC